MHSTWTSQCIRLNLTLPWGGVTRCLTYTTDEDLVLLNVFLLWFAPVIPSINNTMQQWTSTASYIVLHYVVQVTHLYQPCAEGSTINNNSIQYNILHMYVESRFIYISCVIHDMYILFLTVRLSSATLSASLNNGPKYIATLTLQHITSTIYT